MSIYFTYLMILFTGMLLGFIIADKVHRYLKKNTKKDVESEQFNKRKSNKNE